jgi:hypothetical protein
VQLKEKKGSFMRNMKIRIPLLLKDVETYVRERTWEPWNFYQRKENIKV